MIDFIIYLSLILTLGYALIMFFYTYYWRRLPYFEPTTNTLDLRKVSVSVIIAARNEDPNIAKCLDSLRHQDYSGKWEVIVIDDNSTDQTWAILESIKTEWPNLKIMKSNGTGKKSALATGISAAQGEWIVTTDADCWFQSTWLSLIADCALQTQAQCIAAPVAFYNDKNVLEQFQTLDFCGMMGITGAGIYSKLMRMGNGANLAYRKSAFEEVGGFENIMARASGDDMLLMHKIAIKYPDGIVFLKHTGATVYTLPMSDWSSFIRQRVRWASKSKGYSEWQVTAILAVVYFFSCMILFNVFLGCLSIKIALILILQLFVKISIDYYFLNQMTRFFKRSDLMSIGTFSLSTLLHLGYIIGIGTYANLIKTYQWKDRQVQ